MWENLLLRPQDMSLKRTEALVFNSHAQVCQSLNLRVDRATLRPT